MKLVSSLKAPAVLAVSLLISAAASAMSAKPPADPIADFQNSWAGKALAQQRNLDVNSPMIDNNI
ncbi:MAG: hypothetical protein JKX82_03325, partial [Oleispira sp.]|nr:hypothetical protein [Oleispira sp.]